MKSLFNLLSLCIFIFFSFGAEAKLVKYCEELKGAIAQAHVYNNSTLGDSYSKSELKIAKRYCFAAEVSEKTEIIKKNQVKIHNKGVQQKLEAYVWFDNSSKPIKVKYWWADAYLDGEPILLDFVLREETPVSEAEYRAAKRRAKE